MIDPAILDAMLAAGASAEVIVAAVKADAAREDARRAAQRVGNARRQRRYRERLSGDETGDLFERVDARSSSPLPENEGDGDPPGDGDNALQGATDELGGVTGIIPPSLDKSPQTPKINPIPRAPVEDSPREAGAGRRFPCPAGCDPADWRDLLANRQVKRLAMTQAAYRKLIRDLDAQSDDEWPPGRLLAHAAEKGWAQIFDPRDAHQGASRHGSRRPYRSSPTRPASGDSGEPHNPFVRALLRSEARDAGEGGAGF